MSDLYDDERPPVEGVRILGAEEARASLAAGKADDDEEPTAEEQAIFLEDDAQLDLRDPIPAADDRAEPAGVRRGSAIRPVDVGARRGRHPPRPWPDRRATDRPAERAARGRRASRRAPDA